DYVFSYEKMLGMKGNTATYMQYSYARVQSIFRKGQISVERVRHDPAPLVVEHPAERALARALLQLPEAIDRSLVDYRPNHLTGYLFETAGAFADFFQQCPVLRSESDAVMLSRLKLCDLTARTLRLGLSLLGIDVVEKM
ncbi:MAG: DALR anticodon-binding domain-containing protein, partial [Pirellulales bacterium]